MLRPRTTRPPGCEKADESSTDCGCPGALPPLGDDTRRGTAVLAFEDERRVITKDGEGLWETWHGSGLPTDKACGACANREGNLTVYGNWGHSYPNGNSWDDWELLCGACGQYTYVCTSREG